MIRDSKIKMSDLKTNKVPPDGGYGWVVTLAYAMNNVIVLPLLAGFALVLNDTGLTTTQISFVLLLNHSLGMFLSLFGGPLLSRFGYRKIAVLGAIFISAGLMLTAEATEFWQFIVSYSIICSMGVAAILAAFTLAINLFFKEKKVKAIGISMSVTGLGSICMPHLKSFLLQVYGWRQAVLILGAISLHSFAAACLLRPVKWYLKNPPISSSTKTSEEAVLLNTKPEAQSTEEPLHDNDSVIDSFKVVGIASLPAHPEEFEENSDLPPKSLSMQGLTSSSGLRTQRAISDSVLSIQSEPQEMNGARNIYLSTETENVIDKTAQNDEIDVKKKEKKGFMDHLIQFFDLTLLSDPVFVNILFGLTIAVGVEINFSLLFAVIVKDMMKFDTAEIANLMSVVSTSDAIFRFVFAFIAKRHKKSLRLTYMVTLLLSIFTKSMLLFTTSYTGMLLVSLALGMTKTLRTVFMSVVVPTYVPSHRLPFANGIQMFFNGISILFVGFLMTRVREASGSYIMPIIVLNFVTLLTIISWCAEFLYFKELKEEPNPEPEAVT